MFEQAINDQILTWKQVAAVAASEAAVNEVFVLSEYSPTNTLPLAGIQYYTVSENLWTNILHAKCEILLQME